MTAEITNEDRAAWAATAIGAFTSACRMQGEDSQTKARDLATNLVHYLRIKCSMSFEEAAAVIQSAVGMAAQETNEDSDSDEDDAPVHRFYGVRLWGTFRGSYETQVYATSFDEAVKKASELKHQEFNYEFDDDVEGDETMMVYGPDDDTPGDDDPWAGNGAEVDSRQLGEPFSWDACQLVKDLAKINPVTELLPADDPIVNLIQRAKAACNKKE